MSGGKAKRRKDKAPPLKAAPETREEFLARYPATPAMIAHGRILVKCSCDYDGCTGWAWGRKGDLSRWEEEA